MPRSANPNIHRSITRLYLLALTAVALLSVIGQLLIQQSLQNQLSDSRVINVAGRQRMLSQKITKLALLLHYSPDRQQRSELKQELDDALVLWQSSHYGLKNGLLPDSQTSVPNSDTIAQKFASIESYFHAIYRSAWAVSSFYRAPQHTNPDSSVHAHLNTLLQQEPHYLSGMDEIVFQYDAEASARVNQLRKAEWMLLWITLGILVLEAIFIFRPAVGQIKSTIAQLVQAEQKTKLSNDELAQANQQLKETQEALLLASQVQHQREIEDHKLRAAYLMEGQEEERKRIALEIHDGLGQMLTALKFGVEKVSDSVNGSETAQQNVKELRELVKQTIAEARSISFDLMPAVLHDFGLASALKLLASHTSSTTGYPIKFTTNWKNERLPKNMEVGLYRICQEAIQNALKYAQAQSITVELTAKAKNIHLRITDDGLGFDTTEPEAETESPNHGISNMKERAHLLSGSVSIQSSPGQGTQIYVKVSHLVYQHA
ncbi:ATP-binding protein [Rufibacter roseus]|uniref:histidine kinase n=1 Tax=Rufibacter roseus TaxID=1567108 RepID=A0ABW2DKC8_9BACT|nr:type IV pili methyl-accepting chemotaxis transducer N-terminal domain-containing protein [Rufibacter roseus]